MLNDEAERRIAQRVGTTISGKYHLDALLGTGGMGAVYAATHRNGARSAVKLLHHPELSQNLDIRKRFQREAYVGNQIAHSGVVRVLDDDVDADGCAYMVMDLLVGETLEARRERTGGRLPLGEVLSVAVRILDTLAAAHEKGIIHRDIKPENIFLTADGGLKVMDFGIARALDGSGGTRTGTLLGTPAFMPPEQAGARPKEIDARTDVWAVGAVMFVLLTGEDVHIARTVQQQLIVAATRDARPIATRAPVPEPVARVVDKALAFERDHRWQTAAEMRDALPAAALYAGADAGVVVPTATTLADASKQTGTLVMGSSATIAIGAPADGTPKD